MREIITIQVGQTGYSIGEKVRVLYRKNKTKCQQQFWELACDEHGITPSGIYHGQNDLQLERINVYFTEARDGRYVPRSIFTDLDQGSVNKVRNSTYGHLFNPELIINGKTGASNNFAKGFFTEGRDKDRSSSENLNEI